MKKTPSAPAYFLTGTTLSVIGLLLEVPANVILFATLTPIAFEFLRDVYE